MSAIFELNLSRKYQETVKTPLGGLGQLRKPERPVLVKTSRSRDNGNDLVEGLGLISQGRQWKYHSSEDMCPKCTVICFDGRWKKISLNPPNPRQRYILL
jgi:hypothetical protein